MQNATVSATVADHGLPAAQRSELVDAIGPEDLRHDARQSFRLKQARALKDFLRKRAWFKRRAPAEQDESTTPPRFKRRASERRQEADEAASKTLEARRAAEEARRAAVLARAWDFSTRAAVHAEASAALAARSAAVAKLAKAKANRLERKWAGGGEGCSGAAGPSEASEAAEVLDAYMCPITADIMTDPVCTSDGFTYERRAIIEWLRTKDTSPSTGAKLESKKLISNITVRCLLQDL